MFTPPFPSPYLFIQRVRLGLDHRQIVSAREILDLPWKAIESRAGGLLKSRFRLSREDPFEWLNGQPLQTRAQVRQEMEGLPRRVTRGMERRRTSGSSGTPMRFFRSREMSAWMDATAIALYSWHGQQPWARQARMWGTPRSYSGRVKQFLKDRILGRRRFSAYEVSDSSSEHYFHTLRRFKPKHVYAYPSLLHEFVTRCQSMNLDGTDLGMELVITTGEPLFPLVRKNAEEFFGCRVINEYGCTESGILAFECEEGTPHLTPIASWVQALEPEEETPVTGSPGITITTDLFGDGPAFLHYVVGDLISIHPGASCPCGRELPRVDVSAGRENSFIRKPDGNVVYNSILGILAPKGVVKLRGQQTSPSELVLMLEIDPEVNVNEVVSEYRMALRESLGPGMDVVVEAVDHIPRDTSGKLRYFIPYSP